MVTISANPPNGIIFLFDIGHQKVSVPEYVAGQLVSANETCISIGTLPPTDGATHISLEVGNCLPDEKVGNVFVGEIQTPTRRVSVISAEMESMIAMDVPSTVSAISIWTDDTDYPQRIRIVVATARATKN